MVTIPYLPYFETASIYFIYTGAVADDFRREGADLLLIVRGAGGTW